MTSERDVDLSVLAEERSFLRQHGGLRDPEIAQMLGIDWASYLTIFRRHPELGTVDQPQET